MFPVTSANSESTIDKLRILFSTHGIPNSVVTDNATVFVSEEMKKFWKNNGIRHITSSPYHPAANGLAERAVQTFKAGLKHMKSGSLETRIARFLFSYRMTPQGTIGSTPAELLMKRNLRCRFDLLMPDLSNKVSHAQEQQTTAHDKTAKDRFFMEGEQVMVRNYAEGPDWVPARITEQTGPVSYKVTLDDTNQTWRRHLDAIRRYFSVNNSPFDNPMDSFQTSPVPDSEANLEEMVTGHPKRIVRPPDRLTF